jgi:hypothetical protein
MLNIKINLNHFKKYEFRIVSFNDFYSVQFSSLVFNVNSILISSQLLYHNINLKIVFLANSYLEKIDGPINLIWFPKKQKILYTHFTLGLAIKRRNGLKLYKMLCKTTNIVYYLYILSNGFL